MNYVQMLEILLMGLISVGILSVGAIVAALFTYIVLKEGDRDDNWRSCSKCSFYINLISSMAFYKGY